MSRTISVQPFITTLFTWLLLPITTALLPALLLSMVIWFVAGCVTGVGVTGAGATGAGFTGAGFTGAGFTGVGFTGVGFTGAGFTGAGFTGVGFTGVGLTVLPGQGHLFLRAASQLSKRSFTTFKESVNLRFSFNKLSICVVLFFTTGCVCLSFDEFALLLQLTSIIATTATGKARRVRIHLVEGCVFIFCFSFFWFLLLYV